MAIDSLFGLQASSGQIVGARPLFKYGENLAVGTSLETIWDHGGLYSYPSQATAMQIASSSTSDTNQVITVQGLDADWNEVSQTATLNGQNAVSLATPMIRVFRAFYTSGNSLNGNIYIGSGTFSAGVPQNVYARINANRGQTMMAVYSVPAGHSLYVYQSTISSGTETGGRYVDAILRFRLFGGSQFRTAASVTLKDQFLEFDFGFPQVLPEKTDIEAAAFSSSSENAVTASFTALIVKD